jgi:hypothetical protein
MEGHRHAPAWWSARYLAPADEYDLVRGRPSAKAQGRSAVSNANANVYKTKDCAGQSVHLASDEVVHVASEEAPRAPPDTRIAGLLPKATPPLPEGDRSS